MDNGKAQCPDMGNGGLSDTVKVESGPQLGQAVLYNSFVSNMMATNSSNTLGSANLSHRQVGSVSGLADSQVREAEFGLHGKSCKHQTKFRAAT